LRGKTKEATITYYGGEEPGNGVWRLRLATVLLHRYTPRIINCRISSIIVLASNKNIHHIFLLPRNLVVNYITPVVLRQISMPRPSTATPT